MPVEKSPSSFSLLIVEDDETTCQIMAKMISRKFPDCSVISADNGVKGVELFRQFSPDIVLADLNMPVMDGPEMVRQIRSINDKAKIILQTAHIDCSNLDKLNNMGVHTCLSKPLDYQALFLAIERAVKE